jgi:hypothetical protein
LGAKNTFGEQNTCKEKEKGSGNIELLIDSSDVGSLGLGQVLSL